MLIYSLWVMTDYHESKEQRETDKRIHDNLQNSVGYLSKMFSCTEFDVDEYKKHLSALVREAFELGTVSAHSYKARAMHHWPKEDYDAWVAEILGSYAILELPYSDLLE